MSKKLEKAIELLLKAKERGCPFTDEEQAEIAEVSSADVATDDASSLASDDDTIGGRPDGRP